MFVRYVQFLIMTSVIRQITATPPYCKVKCCNTTRYHTLWVIYKQCTIPCRGQLPSRSSHVFCKYKMYRICHFYCVNSDYSLCIYICTHTYTVVLKSFFYISAYI